jgi:hypothetical protein
MRKIIRKIRSDAILKRLGEERQAEIADYARTHPRAEVVAWLRRSGLRTSTAAVSNFLAWWRMREQFRRFEQNSLNLIEQLKRDRPQMGAEEREDWANEFFQLQAIGTNDATTFLSLAVARAEAKARSMELELSKKRLDLDKRRFVHSVIKAIEDRKAIEIATSGMSHGEKIERLGKVLFGADWKREEAAA